MRDWRSRYVTMLGCISVLCVGGIERGVAQKQKRDTLSFATRPLTVQPRAMATGTRNAKADWTPLESFPERQVYVPPSCVGARRCPLLIYEQPNNEWVVPMADKHGIILYPRQLLTHFLSLLHSDGYREVFEKDLQKFEGELRQIFRQFAIDPGKIALLGHCAGVQAVMSVAAKNLDVFSRIVLLSGLHAVAAPNVDPPNGTAEFYLGQGILERNGIYPTAMDLKRAGHKVTMSLDVRGHEWQLEEFDMVGRWLQQSWASVDPAARPEPDTLPELVLTKEALTKMTRFWGCFIQAPDSIRTDARRAHVREVQLPYPMEWSIPVVTAMTDMAALGKDFPSVNACLGQVRLTAEAFETNRVALMAALAARSIQETNVRTGSVLQQNLALLKAHPDQLELLEATGMLRTP